MPVKGAGNDHVPAVSRQWQQGWWQTAAQQYGPADPARSAQEPTLMLIMLTDCGSAWELIKSYLSSVCYLGNQCFLLLQYIHTSCIRHLFVAANDNWTNPSKLANVPAAFSYLFCWIHDLFLLSTTDQALTGQFLSARFPDLIYVLLLPGHSFSKTKTKYQLFLSPFFICRRNYNQHTCSSLIGDKKNGLRT